MVYSTPKTPFLHASELRGLSTNVLMERSKMPNYSLTLNNLIGFMRLQEQSILHEGGGTFDLENASYRR